jgi:hypothetical protein
MPALASVSSFLRRNKMPRELAYDQAENAYPILDAYHRACGRHKAKTGVSYPLVRANCVLEDGNIFTTDVFDPVLVAKWRMDSSGRIRVRLV